MIFRTNISETFEQAPAQPIDEMELLYNDMMSSFEQNSHIPPDVMHSFKIKDSLCPTIWQYGKLRKTTTQQLLQIAQDFFKDVEIANNIQILDVLLVGSLANFNWSKFSDFDLHILIDFSTIQGDYELVKDYFKTQRFLWNDTHNINLHGFPVEIYVQDVKETLESTGIYSLTKNTWIRQPQRESFQLDQGLIKQRVSDLYTVLKNIKTAYQEGQFKTVIQKATTLKDKIFAYRRQGLKMDGEFSNPNIIFKILRRTQYIEYLNDFINKAYDKNMTLSENKISKPLTSKDVTTNNQRPFQDDGNKYVVYKDNNYKIAVDNINDATHITLWHTEEVKGKMYDRKIGALSLNKKENNYLGVSSIEIEKAHRSNGYGKKMYQIALKYSNKDIKGISSYTPNRINKKEVPNIYKNLKASQIDDYQYINKPEVNESILKNSNYKLRYNDNVIVFVSPSKILNQHSKDEPSYDIQNKENQIGNRVKKAKDFLTNYMTDTRFINPKTGERTNTRVEFEASVARIQPNGKLSFEDGRHRILAAKELGIKEVAIEIPKQQAELFKEKFGAQIENNQTLSENTTHTKQRPVIGNRFMKSNYSISDNQIYYNMPNGTTVPVMNPKKLPTADIIKKDIERSQAEMISDLDKEDLDKEAYDKKLKTIENKYKRELNDLS